MSPLLLEKRHVRTIVIIFVLSILISLAGGYVLGYQHAVKKSASGSLMSQLFIPSVESSGAMSVAEY